ncbi:hypothetical protein K2173_011943 [Erythroxylum novogranatense]|uniref:Uncharacterized protein n=1 Tax=Erythroxylum novogranatense TaxID=1862640 RepID=A0AAV8UEB2_9ROSI|nr:hypothetical protein K2173_011943 [Erythroxylum novogranatense]
MMTLSFLLHFICYLERGMDANTWNDVAFHSYCKRLPVIGSFRTFSSIGCIFNCSLLFRFMNSITSLRVPNRILVLIYLQIITSPRRIPLGCNCLFLVCFLFFSPFFLSFEVMIFFVLFLYSVLCKPVVLLPLLRIWLVLLSFSYCSLFCASVIILGLDYMVKRVFGSLCERVSLKIDVHRGWNFNPICCHY